MTTKELIKIAESLGLEYYNECEEFICIKGINGNSTLLYTNLESKHLKHSKIATILDFAKHLKQMDRDSLKMDFNNLLNITTHN